MTNETEEPEQDLAARDELKGLVVEQTRVLERLAKTFAPEEEEERQKRFVRLLVRSASVGALAVSGIIGSWELGVYLKDSWDVRRMADDYAQVGVRLYYQENNVLVAKDFIAKALELQPSNSEYLFLDAYIDGMSAVRDLFNLDRPYDAQELNSAYEALAKSVFLEQQQRILFLACGLLFFYIAAFVLDRMDFLCYFVSLLIHFAVIDPFNYSVFFLFVILCIISLIFLNLFAISLMSCFVNSFVASFF